MPAHQLHYQCLPWRVHPHSVSDTPLIYSCAHQCTWEDYNHMLIGKFFDKCVNVYAQLCLFTLLYITMFTLYTSLPAALTTTLPMWWLTGNQWTWACGIQQDRRTTTGSGLCPTHRQYVDIFAFIHRSNICLSQTTALHWPLPARQC